MRANFAVKILIVALFFLSENQFCLNAARTNQPEVDKLQMELNSVNLQMDYLKVKVEKNKSRIKNLENKISRSKKHIKNLEKQADEFNEKIISLEEETILIQKEQQRIKKQLSKLLSRFRKRLLQLHKIKQSTLLNSVFSAKNLNSFLNRFQMVKYLLENDKKLINKLKIKKDELEANSEKFSKTQKKLRETRSQLEQKRKKIDIQNNSLKAMLKTIVLEKKIFVQKEQKLARARTSLENEITQIEKRRSDPQKNFEKELAPTNQPDTNISSPNDSNSKAARTMRFTWPVKKLNIKSYKAIGSGKTAALQISADKETEVLAAQRGKVLYKGKISGMGNVVIIGHSKGFSTVYGQISDMWVGLGQIVEQQEEIGRIYSGNNHLHFEIRFGGKKQKPLNYLPGSAK
ncbi:MAG: murein hydrolase activator EnvC family protein [Candidatus Rifleibacteriota bacterium]